MFRLVNCTKNIKKISNRTILTSFPANHSCFSATTLNNLYARSKFWIAGINLGDTGINLGIAGINLGDTGINLGITGTKLDDTGIKLGSAGTNLGDTGINLGSAGTNLGITGTNLGSAGTNLRGAGNELTKKVCFFKMLTPVFN